MQYKIPIQIENEDTIIFDLSLRQLGIIIVGVILAFGIFNKFQETMPQTPLFIVCVIIIGIFFIVAKFRTHEMTFLPFLLNMLRFRINGNGPNNEGRVWMRGVDSYSSLQIGYVSDDVPVEKTQKHEKKTDELQEKLKKI
jgi:hypothetical protein